MQVNTSVILHLRNSNKQQLILTPTMRYLLAVKLQNFS